MAQTHPNTQAAGYVGTPVSSPSHTHHTTRADNAAYHHYGTHAGETVRSRPAEDTGQSNRDIRFRARWRPT